MILILHLKYFLFVLPVWANSNKADYWFKTSCRSAGKVKSSCWRIQVIYDCEVICDWSSLWLGAVEGYCQPFVDFLVSIIRLQVNCCMLIFRTRHTLDSNLSLYRWTQHLTHPYTENKDCQFDNWRQSCQIGNVLFSLLEYAHGSWFMFCLTWWLE